MDLQPKNRLRELRLNNKTKSKKSGINVAKYVGISPQYYYDIEKGERRLTTEIAVKLAEYFEVTVDYLLGVNGLIGESAVEYIATSKRSSDSHDESELAEIPIEKLNSYKLTYKGHQLSEEEAADIIKILEASLKRWK